MVSSVFVGAQPGADLKQLQVRALLNGLINWTSELWSPPQKFKDGSIIFLLTIQSKNNVPEWPTRHQ